VSDGVLLSTAQMRAVEAAAMARGLAGAALMEAAGKGVADAVTKTVRPEALQGPVVVLCGPGNNGGDGLVAARLLAAAGRPVRVGLLGEKQSLKGDARLMADLYEGEIAPLGPALVEGAGLVVDALFGTGLARPLEGAAAETVAAANASPAPTLAVDIPSGVDADTGAAGSPAIMAVRTVTFHRKKPGHVLFPGRALCGAVDIVDIGVAAGDMTAVRPDVYENDPRLWGAVLPRPSPMGHKYHRGAVFVSSGPATRTGAARLAARGALRIGAGLVTVLSPPDALAEHAAHLNAVMLAEAATASALAPHLQGKDQYRKAVVVGPAAGVGDATRDKALAALGSPAGVVLDADGLTSFAGAPDILFAALRPDDVLTPHEGEFARLFPDIDPRRDRLAAARAAAARAGAVTVLKGPDTVIAAPPDGAPDGKGAGVAAINVNAPPDLATAGAGDVLAGFIAGLMAQGMSGFAAAAAGTWFHGACAAAVGPGLIAEDLPDAVPSVWRSLLAPGKGDVL